jgi:hypothetical protein
MWDLNIDESSNTIEKKYMVLIGHNDKSSRRTLKSDKNKDGLQILACGEIEKD